MSSAAAAAVAVTFVWLGMVLAISFLEAPLKFRAPGLTLPVGLAIGRLVFGALNVCEVCFGLALVVLFLVDQPELGAGLWVGAAVAMLLVQLLLIRPALTRRTDAVLASNAPEAVPRSRVHLWYVAAELVKVIALVVGGVLLLGASLGE